MVFAASSKMCRRMWRSARMWKLHDLQTLSTCSLNDNVKWTPGKSGLTISLICAWSATRSLAHCYWREMASLITNIRCIWREMASLITNRHILLKIWVSVYESYVTLVMLYGAETWALTLKLEEFLNSCDRIMLKYMARVRWQDKIPSEEVAKRCSFKMKQDKLRRKRLQWFGL